jgi:hypothetical protein
VQHKCTRLTPLRSLRSQVPKVGAQGHPSCPNICSFSRADIAPMPWFTLVTCCGDFAFGVGPHPAVSPCTRPQPGGYFLIAGLWVHQHLGCDCGSRCVSDVNGQSKLMLGVSRSRDELQCVRPAVPSDIPVEDGQLIALRAISRYGVQCYTCPLGCLAHISPRPCRRGLQGGAGGDLHQGRRFPSTWQAQRRVKHRVGG